MPALRALFYWKDASASRPMIFIIIYGRGRGKSLPPLGEGGALARRMRGKCPASAPSSVTCGDSFPRRGKPYRRFTRYVVIAARSRAGHAPPLPRNDFCRPIIKTCPHSGHTLFIIYYLLSIIYISTSSPNSCGRKRGQTFSAVQMTEAARRLPISQDSRIVLP